MALTFLSANALTSLCTMEPAQINAMKAEQGHHAAGDKFPPSLSRTPRARRAQGPAGVTHRVHVEEECMLLLVGVEAFNSVHQGWVSVVEVRVGKKHWRICTRGKHLQLVQTHQQTSLSFPSRCSVCSEQVFILSLPNQEAYSPPAVYFIALQGVRPRAEGTLCHQALHNTMVIHHTQAEVRTLGLNFHSCMTYTQCPKLTFDLAVSWPASSYPCSSVPGT